MPLKRHVNLDKYLDSLGYCFLISKTVGWTPAYKAPSSSKSHMSWDSWSSSCPTQGVELHLLH